MNEICKRTVLFCGTGGMLLAGWRAVPLMESVQIGHVREAVPAEAVLPEAPQASAAETLPELGQSGSAEASTAAAACW